MTFLRYELRKLLHLPALWMIFVLCLGLNILLMTSNPYGHPFFNEVSKITNQIGQRYHSNYISILQEMPQDKNIGALEEALSGYEDPFDDYDTQSLSMYYEEMVKESPTTVRWLQNKYEKAAVRVTKLANSDSGLDIYAGPITHDTHQFLFGTLLRAISVESYILAILLPYLTADSAGGRSPAEGENQAGGNEGSDAQELQFQVSGLHLRGRCGRTD